MSVEDAAWLDWKDRFSSIYDQANYSSTIQSLVMNASHRLLERPFNSTVKFSRVLEVGAGTGKHLAHVRHQFDEYTISDMDPATIDVAKSRNGDSRVVFAVQSAERLTYPDASFDRIVAAHVLEHIFPPHLAIKEWQRVLKPGGTLSIMIPTDPGVAWRIGRCLGPRRNHIAQGLAYDYIMAREHVNSCINLSAILDHYFPSGKKSWWPLILPSVDLNLFCAFNVVVE
jgi:phosphatidylethanolamine/phosphatidyl-N-methylethanolamine N-methyltransferase